MLAVEAVTGKPSPMRRRAERQAAEAARPKTASEKTGEALSIGVEVLGPLLFVPLGILCLAAGPLGWLALAGLAVAGSSSSGRKTSSKVTGFYSPYQPTRR